MSKLKKYCNKGGFNSNNYLLMPTLETNSLSVPFLHMESGVRNFPSPRHCQPLQALFLPRNSNPSPSAISLLLLNMACMFIWVFQINVNYIE